MPDALATGAAPGRARLWWEIALVLGLSLGQSAVYSIVTIVARLTDKTPLSDQSASLNASQSTREWLDFTYQFLDIAFSLFAVGLVLYLLWQPGRSAFTRIGLDLRRPGPDVLGGLALVVIIGIPGLGVFFAGRALGITVDVHAAPDHAFWWTIPMLVFSALRAGLQEEVIVVGYLLTRLREVGIATWQAILISSLLRGSYHLYQGIGPFIGNVAMGVVFGWCYARWGRVMPLVIAHWVIDIISFVGYLFAASWWPGLFPTR